MKAPDKMFFKSLPSVKIVGEKIQIIKACNNKIRLTTRLHLALIAGENLVLNRFVTVRSMNALGSDNTYLSVHEN